MGAALARFRTVPSVCDAAQASRSESDGGARESREIETEGERSEVREWSE